MIDFVSILPVLPERTLQMDKVKVARGRRAM